MVYPLLNILLTLPLLIFFFVFSYLVGSLFIFLIKPRNSNTNYETGFSSVFSKVFTGILLICSLYAIVTTMFQTSLLPIPFLLGIFWRLKNNSILKVPVSSIPNFREIVVVCLLAILIYWIYFSSFFISFDKERISYIGYDTAYYARLSSYLNFSGEENTSLNYLLLSSDPPEPYHYGDIWLTSLLTRLTGLHHTLIIQCIAYPFFASLFVIGLVSYARNFFKQKISSSKYSIFILSCFASGFAILNFLNTGSLLNPLISSPKLLIVACVLILLLESLRQENWNHAMLACCFGMLLHATVGPPTITTLLFVLLIALLTKKIHLSKILPGLSGVLLTVVYLFILYYNYFFKQKGDFSLPGNSYDFKITINIIAGRLSELFIIAPFIILFYLLKKNLRLKNKSLFFTILNRSDLLFLLSLPTIALCYWAFFYFVSYDSLQFFSNILLPVTSIFIVLVLLKGTLSNNLSLKIFSWLLFANTVGYNLWHSNTHTSISKKDFIVSQQFLAKYSPGYFVNLRDPSELRTVFERNTVYMQPLIFLDYIATPYINISLNAPYLNDTSFLYTSLEKRIRAAAPFSRFVAQKNNSASPEEYMYSFIKQNSIQFLTVSDAAKVPPILKPLIKDSVHISEAGYNIYYIGL